MSSDLEVYKQYKKKEATTIYNSNLKLLTSALNSNIKIVQLSTQPTKTKQLLLANLTRNYNINASNLQKVLNDTLVSIQNFIPKKINISTTNKNKALLIGINYNGTPNQLYGCINDANNISNYLITKGFTTTILNDLTPIKPTRENILKELTKLMSTAVAGDTICFMYSGHGTYLADKNGDEKTGYDQAIVPLDFNVIIDDELKKIIKTVKKDVTLFALFDSCFSGSVIDLRYCYMDSLNHDSFTINEREEETNGTIISISGCTDYQTSADAYINNTSCGALTWAFLDTVKTLSENNTNSWKDIVTTMRDKLKNSNFSQIPQLSTGNCEDMNSKCMF